MRQIVAVLGTPLDKLSVDQVMERLDQFVQEKRFHQVATANTDFLINAESDPELRHILRQCDLVVPDGMPVVWASKLLGSPLPERVTGADIVPRIAALAAEKGYRVYLLGGNPDVAKKAQEKLETDYPGINIVGRYSPPLAHIIEMNNDHILEDIYRTEPDILLVAFGCPKQEKWVHMHRHLLGKVSICIGVGGTFDFIAGQVPRAPSALQKSGFEWTHRLLHDPKRLWRRYSRDFIEGISFLAKEWYTLRRQRPTGRHKIEIAYAGECAIVSVSGDLNQKTLPEFMEQCDIALNRGARLILDFTEIAFIDAEAVGALVNLQKRAGYYFNEIRMLKVPPKTANVLHQSHLSDDLFPMSDSLATAITDSDQDGLYWHVRTNSDSTLLSVTVSGRANQHTALQLEMTCQSLINMGTRVEVDMRGAAYVDTFLLGALNRLNNSAKELLGSASESANDGLYFVAGDVFNNILIMEKMTDRFKLISAPTMPEDAIAMSLLGLDQNSVDRSDVATEAVKADTDPVLKLI